MLIDPLERQVRQRGDVGQLPGLPICERVVIVVLEVCERSSRRVPLANEVLAEHEPDLSPVAEEVLLEQRDQLVAEDVLEPLEGRVVLERQ